MLHRWHANGRQSKRGSLGAERGMVLELTLAWTMAATIGKAVPMENHAATLPSNIER